MCVCVCVCIYIYMCVYVYVCVCVCVCVCTYMCVYVCVCVYICVCMCVCILICERVESWHPVIYIIYNTHMTVLCITPSYLMFNIQYLIFNLYRWNSLVNYNSNVITYRNHQYNSQSGNLIERRYPHISHIVISSITTSGGTQAYIEQPTKRHFPNVFERHGSHLSTRLYHSPTFHLCSPAHPSHLALPELLVQLRFNYMSNLRLTPSPDYEKV